LEPQEESFRDAEIACKPEVGIRADIPLAKHNFVDAARGDMNAFLILGWFRDGAISGLPFTNFGAANPAWISLRERVAGKDNGLARAGPGLFIGVRSANMVT
jgi:hypothetical protein